MQAEWNLEHFTRSCKIKNLDDFERDEADSNLWRAGLLNVKDKGMTILLYYEQVFDNVFERRESKCCEVLIKHCGSVKGEQVVTLRMAQQLKTKNVNAVQRELFCRQCKAKFLLQTDSLY